MRIIHILGWSDIVLFAIFNWWAKNSEFVNVNGFYIKGQDLKNQSCGGSEKCKTSILVAVHCSALKQQLRLKNNTF